MIYCDIQNRTGRVQFKKPIKFGHVCAHPMHGKVYQLKKYQGPYKYFFYVENLQ